MVEHINGILLLYHHHLMSNASTIMEHVDAFERYSKYKVWKVNTRLGFPKHLGRFRFKTVVFHYSLFGPNHLFSDLFLDYLDKHCNDSYKIAFFQDEHQYCKKRFAFLNRYKVDCVYTLLEPEYFSSVYNKYTSVPKLIYTLTGYVSDELIGTSKKYEKKEKEKKIDIGYRARKLDYFMGQGAQEKHEIADKMQRYGFSHGLIMDLDTDETKRLYGDAWYEFLADCRAVLGVEAGTSIFDIEDKVKIECDAIIKKNPNITFKEISDKVLKEWEDNIYYRTISPRHFEAAAFRTCQILYEGKYSGIMKPMVHYIPLKKNYSNIDKVIKDFKDVKLRKELTDNAYRDLIESGIYSYRRFIKEFDEELSNEGLPWKIDQGKSAMVTGALASDEKYRMGVARIKALRYYRFPGRIVLGRYIRHILGREMMN